jgi:hypothetical protein
MWRKGRKERKKEGRKEGRKKGRKEGRKEGSIALVYRIQYYPRRYLYRY